MNDDTTTAQATPTTPTAPSTRSVPVGGGSAADPAATTTAPSTRSVPVGGGSAADPAATTTAPSAGSVPVGGGSAADPAATTDTADEAALQIDERQLTRLALWERKLLDFSLRNNLLNTRLGKRALQFAAFDIATLEDHLHSGVNYTITPWPEKRKKHEPTQGIYHTAAYDPDLRPDYEAAIKAHQLPTYLSQVELKPVVTNLYRAARTALEENGANALFIALGMLRWYVTDRSDQPRYAPILLLPVSLVRNGAGYVVRLREEEPMLNITLNEFLRQQYKLQLPTFEPLPRDDHGIDVAAVFQAMRQAIADNARWEVHEEGILGLFSFNKFVMWNDIYTSSDILQESPIVKSLVQQRLTLEQPTDDIDVHEFDLTEPPSAVATPISVDSSQLEAVIDSGEGKSFILYGPPGTGKSQTITNMIANALYQGRRVLFVAEKMAALSVVQKRLAKIGLDPFCLELHSNKVTKTHFLQQLDQALNVTHGHLSESFEQRSSELFAKRKQLNSYIQAVHRQSRYGVSLYDCIEHFLDTPGDKQLQLAVSAINNLDEQLLQDAVAILQDLDTVFQVSGHPCEHPLAGFRPLSDRRESLERLCQKLEELAQLLPQMEEARQQLNATCGVTVPATQEGFTWMLSFTELLEYCSAKALAEDATTLRAEWQAVQQKWFLPRYFATRRILKRIRAYRPSTEEPTIDLFINKLAVHEIESIGMDINELAIASHYDSIPSGPKAWAKKNREVLTQWQSLLNDIAPLCELPWHDDYANTLARSISSWLQHREQMQSWFQWVEQRELLTEQRLTDVVAFIEQGNSANDAAAALQKAVYKEWALRLIDDDDLLRRFSGITFEDVISRYRQLTDHFQELTKKELYCRLAANIPSLTTQAATNSEAGILKRNIANGGRGTSIRHIIDQIPNLLPRLCPCMLMSPISVAQFLDPKSPKFDLVIFDEASQMPTSEAVGAIGRGKALIVVGDNKQMPPTAFFTTQQVDDDDAQYDDLDSILDDCKALSMPERYLAVHYRSKHESLITFSNQEYYDSRLATFPSADDRLSKVSVQYVQGTYDKGGRRSNRAEAEAVVEEVIARLQDPERSQRSIGVVAFSMAQQNLIEDILMETLAGKPDLEARAFQCEEPIFLKNLENVQGDERDIILFSIGYGPDSNGNVSLNFGPLNNRGGERRLNVAVTRARYEMKVFSTLHPEQIDLNRSKAVGVAGLKKFLLYAETGQIMETTTDGTTAPATDTMAPGAATDAVAADIADALTALGYRTETGVGRSQFKVDVAVLDPADPERYLLALLIDTPTRAATRTARDRDLTQPSVLQGLGWKVARLWSIDWLQHRQRVIDTIVSHIDGSAPQDKSATLTLREPTIVANRTQTMRPAAIAAGTGAKRDIASIPAGQIDEAVMQVVQDQVALSVDDIRLAANRLMGYSRRTMRIDNAITRSVARLVASGRVIRDGDIIKAK